MKLKAFVLVSLGLVCGLCGMDASKGAAVSADVSSSIDRLAAAGCVLGFGWKGCNFKAGVEKCYGVWQQAFPAAEELLGYHATMRMSHLNIWYCVNMVLEHGLWFVLLLSVKDPGVLLRINASAMGRAERMGIRDAWLKARLIRWFILAELMKECLGLFEPSYLDFGMRCLVLEVSSEERLNKCDATQLGIIDGFWSILNLGLDNSLETYKDFCVWRLSVRSCLRGTGPALGVAPGAGPELE